MLFALGADINSSGGHSWERDLVGSAEVAVGLCTHVGAPKLTVCLEVAVCASVCAFDNNICGQGRAGAVWLVGGLRRVLAVDGKAYM